MQQKRGNLDLVLSSNWSRCLRFYCRRFAASMLHQESCRIIPWLGWSDWAFWLSIKPTSRQFWGFFQQFVASHSQTRVGFLRHQFRPVRVYIRSCLWLTLSWTGRVMMLTRNTCRPRPLDWALKTGTPARLHNRHSEDHIYGISLLSFGPTTLFAHFCHTLARTSDSSHTASLRSFPLFSQSRFTTPWFLNTHYQHSLIAQSHKKLRLWSPKYLRYLVEILPMLLAGIPTIRPMPCSSRISLSWTEWMSGNKLSLSSMFARLIRTSFGNFLWNFLPKKLISLVTPCLSLRMPCQSLPLSLICLLTQYSTDCTKCQP